MRWDCTAVLRVHTSVRKLVRELWHLTVAPLSSTTTTAIGRRKDALVDGHADDTKDLAVTHISIKVQLYTSHCCSQTCVCGRAGR